jgi:hypothetical protein
MMENILFKFTFRRLSLAGLVSGVLWCVLYILLLTSMIVITPAGLNQVGLTDILARLFIMVAVAAIILGFASPFTLSIISFRPVPHRGPVMFRTESIMQNYTGVGGRDVFDDAMNSASKDLAGKRVVRLGGFGSFFLIGLGLGLLFSLVLVPMLANSSHLTSLGVALTGTFLRVVLGAGAGLISVAVTVWMTFRLCRC